MNTSLVCLVLATAPGLDPDPIPESFPPPAALFASELLRASPAAFESTLGHAEDDADVSPFAAVIRGQTPYSPNAQPYYEEPLQPGLGGPAFNGGYGRPAPSPGFNFGAPFGSGPTIYDPFLGAPPAAVPGGYVPLGTGCHVFGPRPYRYGWQGRIDVGFLPKERIRGTGADLETFELDVEHRYTMPTAWGWIFSFAHQFSWRHYEGTGRALLFPDDVFRLASDFELATPANGPTSLVLGVTPALNTDFQDNATSNAWTLDARAVVFHRTSPQWTWVGGVVFWDRVNDRLLPYAGAIWIPNDHTELRLLFPEARVSKFGGAWWGVSLWYYARAEFHVEAYEFEESGFKDQYEISDWRALFGLRTENAMGVASFVEAGWVFDRQLEFKTGPSFDIGSGFIVRGGLRY